jgi:hypothetical protein
MNNIKTLLTLFATTSTLLGVALVKPSYASEYSSKKSNYVEAVNYETHDSESVTYIKNHNVKYVGYEQKSEEKKDDHDYKSYDRDDKKEQHDRYKNNEERKSEHKPKSYKKTNHHRYH